MAWLGPVTPTHFHVLAPTSSLAAALPLFLTVASKLQPALRLSVCTDSRMAVASRSLVALISTSALIRTAGAAAFDPLSYVDVLIGSSNDGNVFSGASLPYGMAKAVADTNSSSNQGGFTLDGSPVTGFSALHDSGTGGYPSLGETNRPRSVAKVLVLTPLPT